MLGSIIAPGGSISLSADDGAGTVFGGPLNSTFTSPNKSVWVGANAVLDVAGTTLINPFATIGTVLVPDMGKVLPGGTISISDNSGYVVVQSGAVLDVSGTSAELNQPQAVAATGLVRGQPYAPQPVWSNAGSITLGTFGGLFFDGTFKAQAGAPQGQGGTLTIEPENELNGSISTRQADGTTFTHAGADYSGPGAKRQSGPRGSDAR